MKAVLFMLHCKQNTGYAISSLESVFYNAAIARGYSAKDVHFSFQSLDAEHGSPALPAEFSNFVAYDFSKNTSQEQAIIQNYIAKHDIKTVLAFDLNGGNALCKILRESGVEKLISYWGAPISSINSGIKLLLRKLQYSLIRFKPDCYIFESEAMALTGTAGRGIPGSQVTVVNLGVDTRRYHPDAAAKGYLTQQLDIDPKRFVVFYSGHMEPRKGVRVIVEAARELVVNRGVTHIHFIFCGNKGDEADPYLDLVKNTPAAGHITFAGYRSDIPQLMSSSDIGVIASTGWDSFTMSSVEMASSGLPILVSDLQGLAETVDHDVSGFKFETGNATALADLIQKLITDRPLLEKLSRGARDRALQQFDRERQIQRISELL